MISHGSYAPRSLNPGCSRLVEIRSPDQVISSSHCDTSCYLNMESQVHITTIRTIRGPLNEHENDDTVRKPGMHDHSFTADDSIRAQLCGLHIVVPCGYLPHIWSTEKTLADLLAYHMLCCPRSGDRRGVAMQLHT